MSLVDYRIEGQNIDEKIVRLIGERIRLSEKIFGAKRAEGVDIEDPLQEMLVMTRALDLATELNLDAGAVKEIFTILINMSVNKQHELLGDDNLP
ncbi:MAG: chorismate mutase [Methanothrix sp.]|nr:MAG: chorismate mutase [Methanothrix sp.]